VTPAAGRLATGPIRGIIMPDRERLEVAMAKRRAVADEDDGPQMISLSDKHAADRLLQEAFAAGQMDEDELKRRRGRVYAAVTPRELWKATGHRAGSRERADKRELKRAVRLQLAIVVFALLIMFLLLYGTMLYQNAHSPLDTPVFPWNWGD
jgi:Domain of unknown function (DUF1707)